MLESVERYFRAFGARQMPYFQITKENSSVSRIRRIFSSPLKGAP
jgi:hypothetical protein